MAESLRRIREASTASPEDGTGTVQLVRTETRDGKDTTVFYAAWDGGGDSPVLTSAANPLPVTAIQSGAWTVTVANPTETGLATEVTLDDLRDKFTDRTPAALRNGRWDGADTYTAAEELSDQTGAGAVLTFTFADPMDLIWVRSVGDVSRASASGVDPTGTKGVYCADDEPTPITLRATVLKVFAPVGAVVSVWGMRYSS